ncbi:type IV secretion system protein [Vibrio sp. K4]|uniref:type IV secretion system protein n=1 Tax=Vibrio sp. K4 TaxID=3391579 RepID=UPI003DA748A8
MFERLFEFIEQITQNNIGRLVEIFTATITPLLGACVVLYAIYLAYQALYDAENMMIMESMKFIGSLALCTTVALNSAWYLDSIVPIVYYSGDDIADALLGSTGSGSLQTMFDTMAKQFFKTWEEVNFGMADSWGRSILFAIMALLILLGYIPFIAIATAYLLIAKVMVSFLLILGPLFIMFAFFPSTRNMFRSWTGQCLNYVLLVIVYPIAFNLFTETIEFVIFGEGVATVGFSTVIMTIILFGCCILISVQIPVFTSSLSGGVGINGLVSNIGAGLRGASNAAKGTYNAGKAAKQGGGKLSRAIADKFKNNVKPG